MNYILKFALIFTYFSIIFSDSKHTYNYKIKFFGITVANCQVIYSDTSIYDISAKKIQYKVTTNSFIDKIFKVNNDYTIILNKNNYNTLYYKKNTFQPKITNYVETDYSSGILKYKNSDIIVDNSNKNIFSVLYMIHSGHIEALDNIELIEREGKYYSFSYLLSKNNEIIISMDEIDSSNQGIIEHTDIFSWGLFLNNTKKLLFIIRTKSILKNVFLKKGLLQ